MNIHLSRNTLLFFLFLSLLLNLAATFFVVKRLYGNKRPYPWNNSNVIIIGDSRVFDGNWVDGLERNDLANCGISGLNTSTLLQKLDSITDKNEPKICFIQIGINDLRDKSGVSAVEKRYEMILQQLLSDKIKPVVTSVIPIRKDFWQDAISETTVNIQTDSLNNNLLIFCKRNKIDFININKEIVQNKRLKRDYTNDGIHLNEKGYSAVYKELRQYLSRGI